ncbi:MAG: hypothetical protein A4E73_02762 [Syntrophaceae bacterium PtaU1.Bin231]|nr:MAG: hypothetical protein A4E73_02762 [Syntrophaceae bacterium PtaU1.Bin231]
MALKLSHPPGMADPAEQDFRCIASRVRSDETTGWMS